MVKTVKELRTISLREMARRLEISPSYLCDLEKGRRVPSAELYTKMIREYGEGLKDWFEVITVQKVVLKMY